MSITPNGGDYCFSFSRRFNALTLLYIVAITTGNGPASAGYIATKSDLMKYRENFETPQWDNRDQNLCDFN
jgi:hypothetical protein